MDLGEHGTPLAAELQRLLDERGMRLQQLADRSGVHKATLHHWLSGKVRRPYFWDRLLVAIALDLDKPATDKLLHAAGLIPIDRLRAANQPERVRKLLDRWPA